MVLVMRAVLLKVAVCLSDGDKAEAKTALKRHLQLYAALGRDTKHFQDAFMAASVLKGCDSVAGDFEEARAMWARQDTTLALRKARLEAKSVFFFFLMLVACSPCLAIHLDYYHQHDH